MNERLKKLIEQATATEHGADNGFDRVTFDKEKFNELIIQDCIRTLHSNGHNDAAQCLHDIHFGIDDPV